MLDTYRIKNCTCQPPLIKQITSTRLLTYFSLARSFLRTSGAIHSGCSMTAAFIITWFYQATRCVIEEKWWKKELQEGQTSQDVFTVNKYYRSSSRLRRQKSVVLRAWQTEITNLQRETRYWKRFNSFLSSNNVKVPLFNKWNNEHNQEIALWVPELGLSRP